MTDEPIKLAPGGGDATAWGVDFQAVVGAVLSSQMLAERPVDPRLELGGARYTWVRFETEAPVDDILLGTTSGGTIAIQAKSSLTLGSEFNKTAAQMVRYWMACVAGGGTRAWDRPLTSENDRILIAVGPRSSGTIRTDLALALERFAAVPFSAPPSQAASDALAALKDALREGWKASTSDPVDDGALDRILRITRVITFDVDGADATAAIEVLRGTVVAPPLEPRAAFAALCKICQSFMKMRSGGASDAIRRSLRDHGITVMQAPDYTDDINTLRKYSLSTRDQLERYETIDVAGKQQTFARDCMPQVVAAAQGGSLLLVGEPGAGKSAVINALGKALSSAGHDVVQLAVDRLPLSGLEGFRSELSLNHALTKVLQNWEGSGEAFLLIDALDATRGGEGEGAFRALISEVLGWKGSRWHVVASIRTFDLKFGQQFRKLFKGQAPAENLTDPTLGKVRHIRIPPWSDTEFDRILAAAPDIRTAIDSGGPRLRDLARVPFNTRIVAELIADGIAPDRFSGLVSQIELLQTYWDARTARAGTAGEVCLSEIIAAMVSGRHLRTEKLAIAKNHAAALDTLQQLGVLIATENSRFISFRHHLLFDYAASRLYLKPHEFASDPGAFPKAAAVGFILGPALAFGLRELWLSDASRLAFWEGVCALVGTRTVDPLIRGIAARTAAELPETSADASALAPLIQTNSTTATITFDHTVGALIVRLEDAEPTALPPWCHLCRLLAPYVHSDWAWSYHSLLNLLSPRTNDPEDRVSLGIGARALLALCFAEIPRMVEIAIALVAKTFTTDPAGSKNLFRKVFDPSANELQLARNAPALARTIADVAAVDADFTKEVYAEIYSRDVISRTRTPMGNSRIMSLSSNPEQDFGMARYALGQYFPTFLDAYPDRSTAALILAVEGFVARRHVLKDPKPPTSIDVGGQRIVLQEDLSYVWASDPRGRYKDDAETLLVALLDHLPKAETRNAEKICQRIITDNRLAIVWARLFQGISTRSDALPELLFPIAREAPFLLAPDTQKDAIDLIAAAYKTLPASERQAFELSVESLDFSRYVNPDSARSEFTRRLFNTIGATGLVTDYAKGFLDIATESGAAEVNQRLMRFSTTTGTVAPYWFLTDQGIDINAANHAPLVAAIDSAKAHLGLEGNAATRPTHLKDCMPHIERLVNAISAGRSANAATPLILHAEGILASASAKATELKSIDVVVERAHLERLLAIAVTLSRNEQPEVDEDTESRFEQSAAWGSPAPRLDAAGTLLNISRFSADLYQKARPEIVQLLVDSHPAVRMNTAQHLIRLWEVARGDMWAFGEQVITTDRNSGVITHFANGFLNNLLHTAPKEVDDLTAKLAARSERFSAASREQVLEQVGALTVLLWVSHEQPKAKAALDAWLGAAVKYGKALWSAIATPRDGLTLGYRHDDSDPRNQQIRIRCLQFYQTAVAALAAEYEAVVNKPSPDANEIERAQNAAGLINLMCMQLYFSSGAFQGGSNSEEPLNTDGILKFLDDWYTVLKRIGDVGTPEVIHHLLDLLKFLLPADTLRVFDLVVNAVLTGGQTSGFQFESMGAAQVVEIAGTLLAEHRTIFQDTTRRQQLVDLLEVFMNAGWPAARRLVYRLPDVLQ